MKNPWKRYSKVNPQRENGNRQIANDVYQALISGNFLGSEYKLIFAVISKTWGFNKSSDAISIKQFQKMTNLKRRTIQSILKKLKRQRVIYSAPSKIRVQTGSPLNSFLFNKHYDTWKVEGCNITEGCNIEHPLESEKGAIECKTRVQPGSPTKETLKETFTKEIILPDWLPLELWNEFKKYRTKIKKPLGLKAQQLNLAKLEKLKLAGNAPQAVIEQTLEKGWQGFFELPENKGGQHGFQSNNGKTSAGSGSEAEELGKYSGLGKTMLTE
jgi:phage replication O-like protein O